MISLPDLLRRFRRAWAPPGPALVRVAPPVDVAARLRAEVAPLLAVIAEIQQRASAIRADADRQAAVLLDAATHDADAKVREAERQAPSARTTAAELKHHAVDDDIASVLAAARDEARRIEAQSTARRPALLERVRECVLHDAGAPS